MPIELTADQLAAHAFLTENRLSILSAPTGWGKSLVLCAAGASQLQSDPRRKVVVVIPQRVVSKGFARPVTFALAGGPATWAVSRNLCERSAAKVRALRTFLLAEGQPDDRTAVVTHLSLGAAVAGLSDDEVRQVARHLTLIVDEAHHVHGETDTANRLGECVGRLIDLGDGSTNIILATAFLFRGDRLAILGRRQMELFERHHVPFERHWASLRHLKRYRYDFVSYAGTPWADVDRLLKASNEPTIIYCPPEGHKLHLGRAKVSTTGRIVKSVLSRYAGSVVWSPALPADAANVVVNLVDTADRSAKVEFINSRPEAVAVILTVGMFREGADWPKAQRAIDLIPSASDQDRLQRFGRLTRDYPGKAEVAYLSFFPRLAGTKEEQRQQLTTLFAHFHARLILQNAIEPIRVRPQPGETDGNGPDEVKPIDPLSAFPEQKQEQILKVSCETLVALAAEKSKISTSEAETVLAAKLASEFEIVAPKPLARQIVLLLRRQRVPGIDARELVSAGFDRVWHDELLGGLLLFSGGVGGPTTFAEVQTAAATAFDAAWARNFAKVVKLRSAPASGTNEYNWVQHNKTLHAAGKLDPERFARLDAVSWWTWATAFDQRWHERYLAIAKLETCPPAQTPEYNWVRQQRRLKATLPADRVALCDAIPWWTWGGRDDQWAARLDALRKLDSAPSASREGNPDYEFVKYQRGRYAAGKLPAERVADLETVAWWKW